MYRESTRVTSHHMIKLYGNPASTCTRKALMTLEETKTPYEFVVVDFATGEHKGAAHVARQPFGQVPTIEDDGFSMYESRAIMRYVAEQAGSALVPKELKARAIMEQWISVETSDFTPHAMKFVYHHVFQRKQDDAVMAAAAEGLEKATAVVAKQVEQQDYLVGKDLTLADISFMPYIEYGMATPAKAIFAKHPAFLSWWGRLSERATWRKVSGKTS